MRNKAILLLLLVVNVLVLMGQNQDYIVLKSSETSSKDTVWGQITLPKRGVVTNVRIIGSEGKVKYSPAEVLAFSAGEKFFVSVPYNSKREVFAERLVNGKIGLYYYNESPNNYAGGLAGAAAASLSSYYFLRQSENEEYIRVPHAREKARDAIAELFKDNAEIYQQILSDEFRVWKLTEIVQQYNDSKP